jgi:hypothetical protein
LLTKEAIQYDPSLSQAWITWTTFESMIQDYERVRAIFELAVKQALDMPELVWKVSVPLRNLPSVNHVFIPHGSCLRPTSTLRQSRASASVPGTFTSVCWRRLGMSRCVDAAGTLIRRICWY